jgi:hypothetical protein
MTATTLIDNINTVRDFLQNPLIKKSFDCFFKLCFHETICYLRLLKAKGYNLPYRSFDSANYSNDLAIDLLMKFFESKPNRPFLVIFEFYHRNRIADFEKASPEMLYSLFQVLLKGYVRKELAALTGQEDPQIAVLKRRFKDILRGPGYICQKEGSLNAEIAYLQANSSDLRHNADPLSFEEILAIAEKAYLDSKSREKWCELIFKTINGDLERQNYIRKSDLLRAVIAVNIKYRDLEAINLSRIPEPNFASIHGAVKVARLETLDWIKENIINRFIQKKKFTSIEAELFLKAVDRFLSDFGFDGSTYLIPVYFREIMPETSQKEYLSQYKYIFETILNEAVGHFKEILRNDPIICQFGLYYDYGKE